MAKHEIVWLILWSDDCTNSNLASSGSKVSASRTSCYDYIPPLLITRRSNYQIWLETKHKMPHYSHSFMGMGNVWGKKGCSKSGFAVNRCSTVQIWNKPWQIDEDQRDMLGTLGQMVYQVNDYSIWLYRGDLSCVHYQNFQRNEEQP